MLVPKGKTRPESKCMKRLGNVYDSIISVENLLLAHKNACKGKSNQKGVIEFKKNLMVNIETLHERLKLCNYVSPEYKMFLIYEPKEREIFVLPYPDRIIQHAILQKIGDMFKRTFTKNTYSCIKGRGVHSAKRNIEKALLDKEATRYCLKIDVTKFYPSVNHEILKSLLLRKLKDIKLIKLLFAIIDSSPGLPIGNYLSQPLGNFYLSYFDHWLKEDIKIKHLFRYCDDVVIFSDNKPELHEILAKIKVYLKDNLRLQVKGNYQVFPVESRGVDFLGYKMFHTHTLLRKTIKQNFARMLKHNPNEQSIASYGGWLKHCDSINLKRKLLCQIN